MAEKTDKHKEEEKKRKKKVTKGYNVEPAEEPVKGPTGKKGFEV
jgi:hypothetical protein